LPKPTASRFQPAPAVGGDDRQHQVDPFPVIEGSRYDIAVVNGAPGLMTWRDGVPVRNPDKLAFGGAGRIGRRMP
jgi:hypothetical protein